MSRNKSQIIDVIETGLYGGERFYADERLRIQSEFYKARGMTMVPKSKRGSYSKRLRERFEQKRKSGD
jgi:hypothetical protein